MVTAVPTDSPQAYALVNDLRSQNGPVPEGLTVLVGGPTAQYVELSTETRWALPVVLALVLGMSLVFLLVVFRSVLLPVKAVVMNLLATGAALGVLVLVFQHGGGASLLGYTSTGFTQVYLPLTVFALLFGLSNRLRGVPHRTHARKLEPYRRQHRSRGNRPPAHRSPNQRRSRDHGGGFRQLRSLPRPRTATTRFRAGPCHRDRCHPGSARPCPRTHAPVRPVELVATRLDPPPLR